MKSMLEALDDEMRAERADSLSGPDSAVGRELARAIGENVARERAARGFDVDALATCACLSAEQVRLVEAGQALPGLRMIWLLASGLHVPFGRLLAHTMLSEEADPDFSVLRAGRGRRVGTPGGLQSRALSAAGGPGPEVYELTMAAGTVEQAHPHADATFEHIVVLDGRLTVEAGERTVELAAGDSIVFRADVSHRYESGRERDVRALLIMIYA